MDRRRWIQSAVKHRGALHRSLGVPVNETIPRALIVEAEAHPERFYASPAAQLRLQRRARFALNVGSIRRRRK